MKKSIIQSLFYSQIAFLILLPIWMKLTVYLHPLVILVVWFSLFSLVLFCVFWVKKEKIKCSRHVLHALTFFYSIGLLILLFFRPNNQNYSDINLIPLNTILFYLSGTVDFLIAFYNLGANIGLFIPFGLYYVFLTKKPTIKQLLIITLFTISTIEGLQYITRRGSLDIDDLILNVLGVYIGYCIYPLIQKVVVIQ
ncbi:VanZ family protein [Metabacillus rhizolycopersici]|uniref:VanZ family protein n=1 Tax=Metabacillus rhizolycopersici TaxID=2875709 RepID=A0ABS7UZ58_9BACI|nr:VanZ family protein [Metabacillus rhizolycopersici]MBZ5753327.1 VanZ family protein [Metabacillus rhizolycopersici]